MIEVYIKGKKEKTVVLIDGIPTVNDCTGLSNNECEWMSLVHAMERISGEEINSPINIFTDSRLLDKQVNWRYHIKSKGIKDIYYQWNRMKNILSGSEINYNFVSGHQNPAREYL